MRARERHSRSALIAAAAVAALFALLFFPLNPWLSLTMPRHQVMQMPAALLLGLALGIAFRRVNIAAPSWGIAVLVLAMGSLIFWMLPRSIDMAAIHPGLNRLMGANMLAAGFLIAITLRNMPFEVRIAFPGMLASMLLASGATLRSFSIQVCSSFTIEQQHETGLWLLLIGAALLIGTGVAFVQALGAGCRTA